MVASALLFAAMSVGVKLASERAPNAVVVFFRNAFGLLALLPFVLGRGRPGLRTSHLGEHLVRGIAGLGAMYCFFFAIARLRTADAVLLNYSMPLFMPFVEGVWLREPFPRRLWGPLALGFVGVALVLRPGAGLFQAAALYGVAAALFGSLAQVGVRRLTQTEPVARIVLYFGLIATVGSALPLPAAWRTPDGRTWAVLLATGVLATGGQLLLTRAYSYAPAAQVGPFIYAAVVFAALFDWALFGLVPAVASVAGSVLVGAAGALMLRRSETRARTLAAEPVA